jgi:hypothetical protein
LDHYFRLLLYYSILPEKMQGPISNATGRAGFVQPSQFRAVYLHGYALQAQNCLPLFLAVRSTSAPPQ